MPLEIRRGRIADAKADAVVLFSGAASGEAQTEALALAGPAVEEELLKAGGLQAGQIRVTSAGRLGARRLLHAVLPPDGEPELAAALASSYRSVLNEAEKLGCRSVAVPLAEADSIPRHTALHAAVDTIGSFLQGSDLQVQLLTADSGFSSLSRERRARIERYLVERHWGPGPADNLFLGAARSMAVMEAPRSLYEPCEAAASPTEQRIRRSLRETVAQVGESFSEMLLRKIDEKGMTDAECYRKANLDRRLFSKIRSRKTYQPSKPTVLACAIALELPLEETEQMLQAAGFALSRASRSDLIVEFFIQNGNYNIFEINEALFDFGEKTLGC